jgi:hypothetical protein
MVSPKPSTRRVQSHPMSINCAMAGTERQDDGEDPVDYQRNPPGSNTSAEPVEPILKWIRNISLTSLIVLTNYSR